MTVDDLGFNQKTPILQSSIGKLKQSMHSLCYNKHMKFDGILVRCMNTEHHSKITSLKSMSTTKVNNHEASIPVD